MKTALVSVVLVFLLNLAAHTQNRMQVSVYASSDYTEESLSWFMDNSNVSGSHLSIHVQDASSGEALRQCAINISAYHQADFMTVATFTPSDLTEQKPGVYVLRKRGGLFNAVFNRSGNVQINVTVQKQGYETLTTSYIFFNSDAVNGYSTPVGEFILSPPLYLATSDSDPSCVTFYNNEKYYAAMLEFKDKNGVMGMMLIPVHLATHRIPADWTTYQRVAKALAIVQHYDSFSPEKAKKIFSDIGYMQKQLPIVVGSGKAIEVLTPVLQTLIKTAVTGGGSVPADISHLLSIEAAKFFLSESADPLNYTEGFFYHKIMNNFNQIADSLTFIIKLTEAMQQHRHPLAYHLASSLYGKWSYVLSSLALTTDLVEKKYLSQTTGGKMLEAQVKSLAGSFLPEPTKLVEMADYLQSNERALMSSLQQSQKVVQALYTNFDYYWDNEGDAGYIFEKIGGKKIRQENLSRLQPATGLRCEIIRGIPYLIWAAPNTGNQQVNYIIKYSDQPINNQNWESAWHLDITANVNHTNGNCEFMLRDDRFRRQGYYFAIRYFYDDHRASPVTATLSACGQ